HVLPVLAGHLLEHRPDLQTRGIEDRRIVAAPELLGRIAAGCIATLRGRTFGEHLAVPVQRTPGRQDRPAHPGEAAHEEAGVGAQDAVLGLEPGDEVLAALGIWHRAEAYERAHLVHVAA